MCSDAIVSQVLDELGLNLSDELSSEKLLHMLPFCHIVTCVPFLISTVDSRSSEHWRKLVSSSRKEGRTPGCRGWCGRWSGGATEQPQERLTAVTAAEDVNKNIPGSPQLVSFQRLYWHNICCLSCVLKQCGFLFAAFSFTELIVFNQKVPTCRDYHYPLTCSLRYFLSHWTLPNSLKVIVSVNTNRLSMFSS